LWIGGCTGELNKGETSEAESTEDASLVDTSTEDAFPQDASPPDASTEDPDAPDGGQTDVDEPEEPEEPAGNDLDQAMLFTCVDDGTGYTEARLRRIGRSEWTRNTGNSAGSTADKNPFDGLPVHPYSTYAQGESINESILDIYLNSVGAGAYGWATRDRHRSGALASNVREDSISCMFGGGRPDSGCVAHYTEYLLERGVLFRPPTTQQHQALIDFAENALDSEGDGENARQHTLTRVFSAAWMTPGALFHSELGQGPVDELGRQRLGDYELANAIAHALDGRAAGAPGVYARYGLEWSADHAGHLAALRQAASDGTISEPDTIANAVRQYYGGVDPERVDLNLDVQDGRRISRRGEYWIGNGLRQFFRQWLGYDAHINIFKDTPSATSRFGSEVHSDYGNLISGYYGHESRLVEQMDDMIARIVVEDEDVFKNLLTSRTFYTPATAQFEGTSIDKSTLRTNYIYNVTERTEPNREDRWKQLPADERAGVLTHPAFLASHAAAFENDPNPVHRGKWVREELLCDDVPPLPITVDAAFDPDTRDQSTRQRLSEQVDAKTECAGCHRLMNPLGYPFEIYNHAGFLREDDHGSAPDGSAELIDMPDPALNGPVDDAVDMSERFADSPYVKRCFIRQMFRYYMARDERQRDACTLASMEQAYDQSGGSMVDALIALFQSDSFQYRVVSE
jgi:hypothetical protein